MATTKADPARWHAAGLGNAADGATAPRGNTPPAAETQDDSVEHASAKLAEQAAWRRRNARWFGTDAELVGIFPFDDDPPPLSDDEEARLFQEWDMSIPMEDGS